MTSSDAEAAVPSVLDTLFVYGSLRSTCDNSFARKLAREATLLGNARVCGRLYRIASYPGIVLSDASEDWVHGEVYKLHEPSTLLPFLDEYEGCAPHSSRPLQFERTITEARLSGEEPIACWIYVYCQEESLQEDRRIASGDYFRP
ncbi:MAG: gamma-glutamylcyclotransferase [Acidobacteriia bacterium]|nr:gamma-glutamylcyclotransferase [Terriglobia bacterium]